MKGRRSGAPASGRGTGKAVGLEGRSEDWRPETLERLREIIVRADPESVEERKWKKPSRPEGVPVWSHDGILCVADTLKNAVRLTFFRGAEIKDPNHVFNTRLDSKSVRAVDVFEDATVDRAALAAIVVEARRLNALRAQQRQRTGRVQKSVAR